MIACTRKKLLIVVSSYCPVMLADMQRARMLAWDLPQFGWNVEILTPGAKEVRNDAVECDNQDFFSPSTPVHEVGSIARGLFELLGSRTHAWRTVLPIYVAGRRLLQTARFDLVFFSTTTFIYFVLGPLWRRAFGVPYVLDFHDPWAKNREPSAASRNGFKRELEKRVAKSLERVSIGAASGVVSVSPGYTDLLNDRYRKLEPEWLTSGRYQVIPFAAREADLDVAKSCVPPVLDEAAAEIVVSYVGAGGPIMVKAFTVFCRTLAALRRAGNPLVEQLRVKLFGTIAGWREGSPKDLADVAMAEGVGDIVVEDPKRVSYRRSLEILLAADAALILGVDDEGYMPSKLFTYALSGKPLLSVLHRASPAFRVMHGAPGLGRVLWFDKEGQIPAEQADRELAAFLEEASLKKTFDRRSILEPYLADAMARHHAELFDCCVQDDTVASRRL